MGLNSLSQAESKAWALRDQRKAILQEALLRQAFACECMIDV